MRKYIVTSMVIVGLITILASREREFVKAQSPAAPEYVLKTWQVADGGSTGYLWSIEGQPNQGYTGVLYTSLASPTLRARIEHFPAGTKLLWHFVGSGTPDGLPHEDFKSFRAFCESKHVSFEEDINLF